MDLSLSPGKASPDPEDCGWVWSLGVLAEPAGMEEGRMTVGGRGS